jgi:NitT/TauT family transport system permease protein
MKLPMALPQIFTGLKLAAVGVMEGAITGEFIGGGKGFGELIRVAAAQLNTPRVFSLITYLSLLGLAVFWGVVWLERKLVFWRRTSLGEGIAG